MSFPDVTNAASHWAFLPTLVRLALASGTGAFVGLEKYSISGKVISIM
jgi:hypothetical protein